MNAFDAFVKHLTVISSRQISRGIERLALSRLLQAALERGETRALGRCRGTDRILFVSDVNIGDSVNMQRCVEALKENLPGSRIDYVCNRTAHPLVRHNPCIASAHPLFRYGMQPRPEDRARIANLIRETRYGLIVNTCSFLSRKDFPDAGCPVITNLRSVGRVLASLPTDGVSHYVYWLSEGVREMASRLRTGAAGTPLATAGFGVTCRLSEEVFARSAGFLKENGVSPEERVVFFNPDASNPYTFITRKLQIDLLRKLLALDGVDRVFLGHGFTFRGVERQLLTHVPDRFRRRVVVMPETLPIDVYAALVDRCDLFVTGDTGPMHIAAARKVCVNPALSFRNRTALVALFGGTASKIYGYDSGTPGFLPSRQAAPAVRIDTPAACKHLACTVQRVVRTCPQNRCFENTNADQIVRHAQRALSRDAGPGPVETGTG